VALVADPAPPRSGTSPILLLAAVCVLASVAGMHAHLERFITPEKGLGYLLGIVGGSAMLLLLIYPARKRAGWLAPIGSVATWFRIHMALGILGPALVLFHANFRTGATNSNVALVCMLVVSASGLVGRYFYSRIHSSLSGKQTTLEELRGQIARMQLINAGLAFLPDLGERLAAVEARMSGRLARVPRVLRPLVAPAMAWLARREMHAHVRRQAALHAARRGLPVAALRRETAMAEQLTRRHVDLVRRVAELGTYERLFATWHLLHLPLFFMLLVAGVVHVVAVHLY
jgi:hypothetical protein